MPATEDMIGLREVSMCGPQQRSRWISVSSSVEDDPAVIVTGAAGTGIHTVTLYYLNAAGVELSEDINLNGQTSVATTSTAIYRVQNLRAKVCGTGKTAAGNITLSEHSGTTYKYGYIAFGPDQDATMRMDSPGRENSVCDEYSVFSRWSDKREVCDIYDLSDIRQ